MSLERQRPPRTPPAAEAQRALAAPSTAPPAPEPGTAAPAAGAARLSPLARLQRAERLGHRVVLPVRTATVARHVVQRLSATVSVIDGKVVAANIGGSRPPGNLRSGTGDHTTPYVTFEHAAHNNVIGQSVDDAVFNLVLVLKRTKQLPGYAEAGPSVKKYLDPYADKWINFGEGLTHPTKQDIQSLMEAVVSLRNAVPLTAYKHTTSAGGHNEAGTAGGLTWAEFQVRHGKWTKKTDFKGNPLQNVWDTFDFLAPPASSDARTWARLLRQHILSIRDSYPYIFEIEAIYTMQDMEDHLVNTVLPAKFSTTFAQEITDEL